MHFQALFCQGRIILKDNLVQNETFWHFNVSNVKRLTTNNYQLTTNNYVYPQLPRVREAV